MTETLARISARRPLLTIALWVLVLVVASGLNVSLLESATTTELRLNDSAESQVAASILEERLRGPEPINEVVIVQSESLTVDDEAFQEKVETVFESLMALGAETISSGQNYYRDGSEALVSSDRKTTIMPIVLTGSLQEAEQNVEHVLEVVAEADGEGDFRVLMGGTASISYESNELATHDLEQGERFGVPVALIILLVLFGTVIAALVPIGLAIVAIIIALALVAVIGQFFELVFFVTLMITMIGLAVGIDYSLFIISRFREEMHRSGDKLKAVEKTGETAGRTVLFSGLTVVIALIGMLIVPASFFPVSYTHLTLPTKRIV